MPPFQLGAEPAALLYLINLTAGLLDGDGHLIEIVARAGTRAVVTGQSATRVHPAVWRATRPSNGTSRSRTTPASSSCPARTIPFRGSRYYQRGRVELAPRARLIWGDIWLAGRYDRGELSERFQFERIVQDFEVRRPGRLVYRDRFRWDGPWAAEEADWYFGGEPGVRQPVRRRPGAGGPTRARPDVATIGVPARHREMLHPMVRPSDGRHGGPRTSGAPMAAYWTVGPDAPPWLLASAGSPQITGSQPVMHLHRADPRRLRT